MGYLQTALHKRNKYSTREKVTLYYCIALLVSFVVTPLVRTSTLNHAAERQISYTMVYAIDKVKDAEAPSTEQKFVVDKRRVNKSVIPVTMLLVVLVLWMMYRNMHSGVKIWTQQVTGVLPHDSIIHLCGIIVICMVVLAIGSAVGLTSSLEPVGGGFIWMMILLVSGIVRHLYMLVYSARQRYRQQHKTPFTTAELASLRKDDVAGVSAAPAVAGGLFDTDGEGDGDASVSPAVDQSDEKKQPQS